MHRSRAVALAGVLLTAAALALPYATVGGLGTLDGLSADAWPVVLPAGALGVLALAGDRREPPSRWAAVLGVLLALGAAGFAVLKVADARAAVADAGGSVGIGAWAVSAASLVLLGGAALGFSRRP